MSFGFVLKSSICLATLTCEDAIARSFVNAVVFKYLIIKAMRANMTIKLDSSSHTSLLWRSILLIILVRLIVINLVIVLRSMWARHSGNGCIHACAYKFGWGEVGAGISRVFAVPTFLSTACGPQVIDKE